MNAIVSLAKPSDLIEISFLLSQNHLPVDDIGNPHIQFMVLRRPDQNIIGVCGLEILGTIALLRSLAVNAELRNHGYGQELISSCLQFAIQQGIQDIYLLTTTAADYLERHGFKRIQRDSVPTEIKTTQQFKGLCPSSAVCMKYLQVIS